jgi:urease accessory protein
LLRAARAAWPQAPWLPDLGRAPHHAIALGACAAAAGCAPGEAARIAAYQAVSGPASAAVRLLALDPMAATAIVARLAGEVDDTAQTAAAFADGPPAGLPFPSAPALDLLAQAHMTAEVRLFES